MFIHFCIITTARYRKLDPLWSVAAIGFRLSKSLDRPDGCWTILGWARRMFCTKGSCLSTPALISRAQPPNYPRQILFHVIISDTASEMLLGRARVVSKSEAAEPVLCWQCTMHEHVPPFPHSIPYTTLDISLGGLTLIPIGRTFTQRIFSSVGQG